MDGKPWTMRMQRDRSYGNPVCPSVRTGGGFAALVVGHILIWAMRFRFCTRHLVHKGLLIDEVLVVQHDPTRFDDRPQPILVHFFHRRVRVSVLVVCVDAEPDVPYCGGMQSWWPQIRYMVFWEEGGNEPCTPSCRPIGRLAIPIRTITQLPVPPAHFTPAYVAFREVFHSAVPARRALTNSVSEVVDPSGMAVLVGHKPNLRGK